MYDPALLDAIEGTEIAVIGMSCRFPGAKNVEAFWRNLRDGVESITFFDEDGGDRDLFNPMLGDSPDYVRAAPILDDIAGFDAAFFGYNPREAEVMDPQHRLFLEGAWHALEHAGYARESFETPVGVFAGARTNTYLLALATHPDLVQSQGAFEIGLGNDFAFLSSRVAYKLNLRGPAYSVHSACSTGLVAVHLACQSLLLGECGMALAGAVAINVPQKVGYLHTPDGILSPDGHCRAFDASAAGTVFGNGLGLVVLKRLEDAIRDADTIHAVIRGTATNNDGAQKPSFTAPAIQGQTEVILEALAAANVSPETIQYLETHGTGTALGDPIEVRALTRAFNTATTRRGFCALGSVKTNFGHLDAAAGMASLIKTVLALKHGELPPTLHFEKANPNLHLEDSPFYVNDSLRPWTGPSPRRAGVSSFGVGGTNAHLILEEAPRPRREAADGRVYLPLAAKNEAALGDLSVSLAAHLRDQPETPLADLAFTFQEGRAPFPYRRVVHGHAGQTLVNALEGRDPHHCRADKVEIANRPVVFMFPGNGAQHVHMARRLYQDQPVFREALDACREVLADLEQDDPLVIIDGHQDEASGLLDRPGPAMNALFSVEYALARLWMALGVTPKAMIGHSLGEYVAACLAGVFSLRDALVLVTTRGRLLEALPPGAMLGLKVSPERAETFLRGGLSISAINAPRQTVIAGKPAEIDQLAEILAGMEVEAHRLHVAVGFHSPLVEPILPEFLETVRSLTLSPPGMPYISCLTGTWAEARAVTDPEYWVQHLRQSVRFSEGFTTLLEGPRTFLEVGPGSTLCGLAREHIGEEVHRIVASLPHPRESVEDDAKFASAVGALWCCGTEVDWQALRADRVHGRVPAPLYPFQRQNYWIEPRDPGREVLNTLMLGKQPRVSRWFHAPVWQRTDPLPAPDLEKSRQWLVFLDSGGTGRTFADYLIAQGQKVATVSAGADFQTGEEAHYRIDPGEPEDYTRLFQILAAKTALPEVVAHFWSISGKEEGLSFETLQNRGYYSLLFLARALDSFCGDRPVRIRIFADRTQAMTEGEATMPEKATLIGPLKVLPQEHERLSCALIDLPVQAVAGHRMQRWFPCLAAECLHDGPHTLRAYRGLQRWEQILSPAPLRKGSPPHRALRQGGVYWLTGGLGGVGYLIGAYLAEHYQARLVLTSRSGLPPREHWDDLLAEGTGPDVQKIERVRELKKLGGKVQVMAADAADEDAMATVLAQILDEHGRLDGVLHAAGVTQGESLYRPAVQIGVAESRAQFQPKVHGLMVLEKVLRPHRPDFVMLFSSNAATLGGLGYVAYAAANAFMDAFAVSRAATAAFPWLSVDWDPWPEETKHYDTVPTGMDAYAMSVNECREAFRRAATIGPEGRIIVTTGDLGGRYHQWISAMANPEPPVREMHERPGLGTAFAEPRDETEAEIAEIWQEVLGISRVGIHDNFFELGGHSLLATRLSNRIRKTYDLQISLTDFFESPTVAALADTIKHKRDDESEKEKLEILDMLAELSEDEASAQLEEWMG